MHLQPASTVSLDEGESAVDLAQPPGDVVVLSFADSDLAALAAARAGAPGDLTVRLASLRRLKHPLSVDLYVENTVAKARFVLVRCLGGLDYWRYGVERLAEIARANGIALALVPGDDRPDARLAELSTVPPRCCDALEAYFTAGGVENMGRLLAGIDAWLAGRRAAIAPPIPTPRAFAWSPEHGPEAPETALARLPADRPLAPILVYRSAVLAGETTPARALSEALAARGLAPLVLAVSSLKDPEAVAVLNRALALREPAVILATTAFSAREGDGFVLDAADCPILQAIPVGTTREAWASSERGLSAADLAMQIALPEFDGRIVAGPISFKAEAAPDPALAFARRESVPDAAGIAAVADRAAAWARLAATPRAERRLALVLSDYPARGGRTGFAVGLDTPASTVTVLDLLAEAGYDTTRGVDAKSLIPQLLQGEETLRVPLARHEAWLAALPADRRAELAEAWRAPQDDAAFDGEAFVFRVVRAGAVTIALQPDRGRGERKASYHDPNLPPTHAYCAFYAALAEVERIDALIHLGTHGTTEWLPGKAVALAPDDWPALLTGATPVIYPFVVDDPGEAAPAKRRIGAVTIGHLTPDVTEAGLDGEAAALKERVEEFSSAQVLDPRRAALVAADILERARASGLAEACGVDAGTPMDEALTRLDAHLCDLAETAFRDGLHVFATSGDPTSARGERDGLLTALDGRFVPPGPSGSPSRGRIDVMPTGRNLTTLDPRAIPTRAAAELGRRAAAEIVRRHLQEEGDYPRRVVMDLWASPTLRTGGEDIAQALALMGVAPVWDHATTRVTGFEILPIAKLDHPRADVTVRVSGAFRDTFPDQLALLDQAARAIAALEEEDDWNALAAARRAGASLARVFGPAPGENGAGVASLALDGTWETRADLGRAYLANTSHAYGAGGTGAAEASFDARVAAADAFVHTTDVAERDLLDGDAVPDAVGGFAAAAETLGATPALYSLDTTRADPKARTLAEDLDRIVRGRLTNPRFIAGCLRHGWRGGAELAQGVDALYAYAATTDAVSTHAFEAVFAALVADEATNAALREANAPAEDAIRARLADALRRGLWVTRSNSVAAVLAGDRREAAE
ncbi:cobaltochelatase subunit CobN [Salinarimonas ramus]|uniref:Cobaltochelatase subunit CobN n=1 Tax=Salinarimonas ramus TaxID=690164 RepID=A0A917V721_9HYPH|nr:cobaltochelatase subunit CobN [Salinarimonas ramus]GGK47746.1 cobaltochelatase subunit CobN [Salinarimonas ramus]